MDGFVVGRRDREPMGYYPPEVLPFAYSLASTFTLANRWFCSVPGPDLPEPPVSAGRHGLRRDRRPSFDTLLDQPPPNGTIFDRLSDARHQLGELLHRHPHDHGDPLDRPQAPRPPPSDQQVLPRLPSRRLCRRSASSTPRSARSRRSRRSLAALPSIVKDASSCSAPTSKTSLRRDRGGPRGHVLRRGWAHKVVEAVLARPPGRGPC